MSTNNINRLVGDFMGLYESWQEAPESVNWGSVRTLASQGAQAYNEGNGPSFQILAFDGYPLGEFHERFFNYLLDEGFDPFMTLHSPIPTNRVAVFNHEGLADMAPHSPAAMRMLQRLREIARKRLLAADSVERRFIVQLCKESIPADILQEIATAGASA
jgi:hypothetical protein